MANDLETRAVTVQQMARREIAFIFGLTAGIPRVVPN
jgi:hypothetical protein